MAKETEEGTYFWDNVRLAKALFSVTHPLVVLFGRDLHSPCQSLFKAGELSDFLVATPHIENEHGGSATGAVTEHANLLPVQINGCVAEQTKQSIVERASVDVAELLGQEEASLSLVTPVSAVHLQ